MAKSKTGFVPPKGKPSGNGKETHGLKNAFAVTDLEQDNAIAEKYTDGADELSPNVNVRHVNRNLSKGEDNSNDNK
ncbi:hypothetical protein BDE36_3006 [Arcticibacter tournemirensis]|uniref:Uncharacterized protein n=1 Tax=Arcticibacter tournemirensis TaxID=699437 RepID=A0A5M9GNW4_9SPHI|nr:hypothetical protein [Arcticibacter tournemirensis]KAA8476423.1 hypothetical protein F1649_20120 [Arcticibacter tournemirensis]TQM51231.1 hypothetical protein BDE36_3006 [Arcticibacter tournemirensis]